MQNTAVLSKENNPVLKFDLKGSLIDRFTPIMKKYKINVDDYCNISLDYKSKKYFHNKILKDQNFLNLNYYVKNKSIKNFNLKINPGIIDISFCDLIKLKQTIKYDSEFLEK